ncbi:hypothetical protein LJC46_08730 [Desulfovibrio sp. OttesenSCG-928-G15]|nr:hypothetical protein [Desulfovibrio sp. OttesenSCG-928-G15]
MKKQITVLVLGFMLWTGTACCAETPQTESKNTTAAGYIELLKKILDDNHRNMQYAQDYCQSLRGKRELKFYEQAVYDGYQTYLGAAYHFETITLEAFNYYTKIEKAYDNKERMFISALQRYIEASIPRVVQLKNSLAKVLVISEQDRAPIDGTMNLMQAYVLLFSPSLSDDK